MSNLEPCRCRNGFYRRSIRVNGAHHPTRLPCGCRKGLKEHSITAHLSTADDILQHGAAIAGPGKSNIHPGDFFPVLFSVPLHSQFGMQMRSHHKSRGSMVFGVQPVAMSRRKYRGSLVHMANGDGVSKPKHLPCRKEQINPRIELPDGHDDEGSIISRPWEVRAP